MQNEAANIYWDFLLTFPERARNTVKLHGKQDWENKTEKTENLTICEVLIKIKNI